MSHKDRIDHQGHEPKGVNEQGKRLRVDVRRKKGRLGAKIMGQILEPKSKGNCYRTDSHGANAATNVGHALNRLENVLDGNLKASVHKGSVENSGDQRSSCEDETRVRPNESLSSIHCYQSQLDSTPKSETRGEEVGKRIEIMLVIRMERMGKVVVRRFRPKDRPKVMGLLLFGHGESLC